MLKISRDRLTMAETVGDAAIIVMQNDENSNKCPGMTAERTTVLTILFYRAAGRISERSPCAHVFARDWLASPPPSSFWLGPALAPLGPELCTKERIKGFMPKFSWVLQPGGCDTVRFVCLFLHLLSLQLPDKISSCCSLCSMSWHPCLWTSVASGMVMCQKHHRPSTWIRGLPTVS